MDDKSKKLAEALDLIPMAGGEYHAPVTHNPESKDFEYARQNLYKMIELGVTNITELSELARAGQHPRNYEALTALLLAVVQSNKELLHLQELNQAIKEKIQNADKIKEPGNRVTNLFVGSTADLQRMIQEQSKIIDHDSKPDNE